MMRVRLGGNEFEGPFFERASRLAGWFREEFYEVQFMCMRCEWNRRLAGKLH